MRVQAKAEAAAAAMAALDSAPPQLWLPLAAAVAPLIESCPPAFDSADTEALLLRLQVCSIDHTGILEMQHVPKKQEKTIFNPNQKLPGNQKCKLKYIGGGQPPRKKGLLITGAHLMASVCT